MNMIIVIDEWGWAFEYFARGWKKYSKFNIEITKYNQLTKNHVDSNDVVFAMSTVVHQRMHRTMPVPPHKLVVGIRSQYSHEMPGTSGWGCAGFIANSEAAYKQALACCPDKSKLYYLLAAIDGEIFTPGDVSGIKNVGWAGNPGQKVKRTHLMNSIAAEYGGVVLRSQWGPAAFVPGKTRDDQVAWLRRIGCYLQTSSHEGLSQSLMEAFACGVPVVATPAGDTNKLVKSEWTIPIDPQECIAEANRKINTIFGDKELARQIGIENRKKFDDEGWCWSKRASEYDMTIEKIIGNI